MPVGSGKYDAFGVSPFARRLPTERQRTAPRRQGLAEHLDGTSPSPRTRQDRSDVQDLPDGGGSERLAGGPRVKFRQARSAGQSPTRSRGHEKSDLIE